MSPTAKQVLEQALQLSDSDRAALVGALIETIEGPEEPGVEEAWAEVVRRRVEQLDRGEVETIPWSEVREQLFRGFE